MEKRDKASSLIPSHFAVKPVSRRLYSRRDPPAMHINSLQTLKSRRSSPYGENMTPGGKYRSVTLSS